MPRLGDRADDPGHRGIRAGFQSKAEGMFRPCRYRRLRLGRPGLYLSVFLHELKASLQVKGLTNLLWCASSWRPIPQMFGVSNAVTQLMIRVQG